MMMRRLIATNRHGTPSLRRCDDAVAAMLARWPLLVTLPLTRCRAAARGALKIYYAMLRDAWSPLR